MAVTVRPYGNTWVMDRIAPMMSEVVLLSRQLERSAQDLYDACTERGIQMNEEYVHVVMLDKQTDVTVFVSGSRVQISTTSFGTFVEGHIDGESSQLRRPWAFGPVYGIPAWYHAAIEIHDEMFQV